MPVTSGGAAGTTKNGTPVVGATSATAKPKVTAKPRRPLYRKIWFWVLLVITTGLGAGSAYGYQLWQNLEAQLPESVSAVATYTRKETMRVKAADGTVLQELGPINHDELAIDDVPDLVVQAFIASEDRRFLQHQGVDYQGIARAAWVNLRSGDLVEGGSTITQQLSRIVFLNQDKAIARKLKEMRIAQKIEQEFTKEEILERYLNLIYLGSDAYGVADAAWIYFGKTVDELTVAESATLAGIAPAPSDYSPLENPDIAKERRNAVLSRLYDQGFISESQYNEAIAQSLELDPKPPKRNNREVPYFTDYVQKQLSEYLSAEQIEAGGLTVETTINLRWQKAAEATIKEMGDRYAANQGFSQASLIAIDPRNGQIKAMIGGRDYYNDEANGQFNRVTQAKRQPGSTFKPFVYATAIAAGFSPYKSYKDAPYVVDGYQPENYGKDYRGTVSMRDALTYSVNIPAVRALIEVGWNPVIKLTKSMGIESELKQTYSLALGSSEVTALELTSAYGTLANHGEHRPVHGITRILDREGEVLYEIDKTGEQVLDKDSAAIMTWMLQTVVQWGTGTAAQIGRPAAGKTGTSDDYRDLWFVGYVPQLVTGIWLGNDDNTPTRGASSTAAAFWRNFMNRVLKDIPKADFPKRPDQLGGRKPTIKAEPVKPNKSYYKKTDKEKAQQSSSTNRKPTSTPPKPNTNSSGNRPSTPAPRNSSPANNTQKAPKSSAPQPQRPGGSRPPTPAPVTTPAPAPVTPTPPPQNTAPTPPPQNTAPTPPPPQVIPDPPAPTTPPPVVKPPKAPPEEPTSSE
ncbi:MAG: PBP1A family penicillin-binding protein [Spirulina sp. SIO3F2]|nr:PBP1A family penicillin-binding protein [Spirulina sp. SIO3F2]